MSVSLCALVSSHRSLESGDAPVQDALQLDERWIIGLDARSLFNLGHGFAKHRDQTWIFLQPHDSFELQASEKVCRPEVRLPGHFTC
jgi:hypothetical protein